MTILLLLSLAIAGAATPEPNVVAGDAPPSGQQQVSADTATAAAQATSQNAVPASERRICRRQTRIGTLAGSETVCHTAAEWQAMARGSQESYRQLQGTLGSTHSREGGGGICRPNGEGC